MDTIYNLLKNGFQIWDDGKKINCIIGGINTDGTVWVRMSKDGADEIQIYDVKGKNIEIKINKKKEGIYNE